MIPYYLYMYEFEMDSGCKEAKNHNYLELSVQYFEDIHVITAGSSGIPKIVNKADNTNTTTIHVISIFLARLCWMILIPQYMSRTLTWALAPKPWEALKNSRMMKIKMARKNTRKVTRDMEENTEVTMTGNTRQRGARQRGVRQRSVQQRDGTQKSLAMVRVHSETAVLKWLILACKAVSPRQRKW